MSMSLDRLFFFWRKGDSLLIEKREQDLFERMKNCIGCTYISDLPRYRYEVWEKMKRISLDQYTLKHLRVCVWNPILDGKTNAGKGGDF